MQDGDNNKDKERQELTLNKAFIAAVDVPETYVRISLRFRSWFGFVFDPLTRHITGFLTRNIENFEPGIVIMFRNVIHHVLKSKKRKQM